MFKTIKNNLIFNVSSKIFGVLGLIVALTIFLASPTETNAERPIITYRQPSSFNSNEEENTNYNPTPYVSSVSPNIIETNSVSSITVKGSGFTSKSIVRLNGATRTASYINQNTMILQLNQNDVSSARNHTISVLNGTPGGGISNGVLLRVNESPRTSNVTNSSYSGTSSSSTSSTNNTFTNTSNSSTNGFSSQNSSSNGDYIERKDNSNLSANAFSSLFTRNKNTSTYNSLTANAFFGTNSFLPTGILQWFLFIILMVAIIFVWRKFFGGVKKYRSTPLKHA